MRYGERKFGGATCTVKAALGLPKDMQKDVREIVEVYTDPLRRGQGDATKMLHQICKEADAKRMVLMLTVEPFSENQALSKDQLLEWYTTTFDFNTIQAEPLILARMFNPFPESGLTEKMGQIITEGI